MWHVLDKISLSIRHLVEIAYNRNTPAWQASFHHEIRHEIHHWWQRRQAQAWQSPHFQPHRQCTATNNHRPKWDKFTALNKESQKLLIEHIHTLYWTNQHSIQVQKWVSYWHKLTQDSTKTVSEWNRSYFRECDVVKQGTTLFRLQRNLNRVCYSSWKNLKILQLNLQIILRPENFEPWYQEVLRTLTPALHTASNTSRTASCGLQRNKLHSIYIIPNLSTSMTWAWFQTRKNADTFCLHQRRLFQVPSSKWTIKLSMEVCSVESCNSTNKSADCRCMMQDWPE